MCRETVDQREDVQRIWWLTVEYLDSGSLQDELHVELIDPPGRDGASAEFVRDFEWCRAPVGRSLFWTFTPRPILPRVRAVAELVAERRQP
jgi:hypothetical protein